MRWSLLLLAACWTAPPAAPATPLALDYPAVERVTDVAVGDGVMSYAGCVVERDGAVECWGGPNILWDQSWRHGGPKPGPRSVVGLGPARAVALGVNYVALCALGTDERVRCMRQAEPPVIDAGVEHVAQLAVGSEHACVLTRAGDVWCWGSNTNGQVGTPPPDYSSGPVDPTRALTRVDIGGHAVAVAAAAAGSCAIRDDGKLVCWGITPLRDYTSQTHAEMVGKTSPAAVAGLDGVVQLGLGTGLLCALTRDERVLCVPGDGTHPPSPLRAVTYEHALGAPVELAVGGATACVRHAGGAVSCTHGRAFRRIDGLTDAARIAAGYDHTCVVTRRGLARCFGKNNNGQLGDGTLVARDTPLAVVRFHFKLVPAPPVGVLGCTTDVSQRAACAAKGDDCMLEAPVDAWAWPSGGGAHCGEECIAGVQAELAKRPVPACECRCDDQITGPPAPPTIDVAPPP